MWASEISAVPKGTFYLFAVPVAASSSADRLTAPFHAVAASESEITNRYSESCLNLLKLLLCRLSKANPSFTIPFQQVSSLTAGEKLLKNR